MPQPLLRPEDPMAAHLDALYDRVARLERRPISSGGSFDPNENPVIIGSGATAGGGSTPSNLTGGAAHAVAIGNTATASHIKAIAIGYLASADHEGGVAIGENAAASTDLYGVAIGTAAAALDYAAIAIGHGAQAKLDGISIGEGAQTLDISSGDQVAIGHSAHCASGHHTSVALGAGATTTAANQIMLGTSTETVVMPGNFDGSHLPIFAPTAGSGKVWNNGGVLTVA